MRKKKRRRVKLGLELPKPSMPSSSSPSMILPKGGASYASKVLGVAPANLIGYWQLNEKTGTNAVNSEGTAARDGTYVGVTLNNSTGPDGQPVGLWDGANDLCELYTANLEGVFNGSEGTMHCWMKVSGVGVWTDVTRRMSMYAGENANNLIYIAKDNANNAIKYFYAANGIQETVNVASGADTGWIPLGITWSKSAGADGEVRNYFKGTQSGVTLTALGVYGGDLVVDRCNLGRGLAANFYDGYLAHAAIWTTPLTAAQMLDLAAV